MDFYINLIILSLGLCIGSFINVCIYRIPISKSIVSPPSSCTSCGERIKAWDLIPIISYILLRGKCRNCNIKVSIKYPLIELLVGIMFLLTFIYFGFGIEFIIYSIIVSIFIIILFIDLEHMIIPDGLNVILAVLGLILNIVLKEDGYVTIGLDMLYGLLLGGGFFFILALFGGMGGGDIKLMAALGIIFGWKMLIPLMFLSFMFGGVFGIILLSLKSKGMKDMIPFGPYIVVASTIIIVYGQEIIDWYMSYYVF